MAEEKIGTYMTNGTFGFRLSNKSFGQKDMNFISLRPQQSNKKFSDRILAEICLSTTGVLHNTMLEGYGIVNTTEHIRDTLTPVSRYFLKPEQVHRLLVTLNTTLSYTTRFATFFYNWFAFSPETKLGKIGINSPITGVEMDISKRWHRFAEVGLIFNVH
jgi:hypothetical protein